MTELPESQPDSTEILRRKTSALKIVWSVALGSFGVIGALASGLAIYSYFSPGPLERAIVELANRQPTVSTDNAEDISMLIPGLGELLISKKKTLTGGTVRLVTCWDRMRLDDKTFGLGPEARDIAIGGNTRIPAVDEAEVQFHLITILDGREFTRTETLRVVESFVGSDDYHDWEYSSVAPEISSGTVISC